MNILFGTKEIEDLRRAGNFTVLELDIIQASPDIEPQPAYCVLNQVPLTEIASLANKVTMHQDMINCYRDRQWDHCLQLLKELYGSWNGEVDSFYSTLAARITNFKENDPGPDWDAIYRTWERN